MERLTQPQLRALLKTVRDCYVWHNQETLASYLLRVLPQLIPAEITSYTEFNLSKRQSRLWLIEPADAATCEDQRIFEAHAGEQPLIVSYLTTRNGGALKNSDFLTRRQFHRTALYNEFYRRVGMEHTMAIHLGTSSVMVGIALHRARADFSERNRLLLDLLRPHLVQAHANAEAVTQMGLDATLLQQIMTEMKQGVVILTRDGLVRLMTAQARVWLRQYFDWSVRSANYLPDTLERWRKRQDVLLTGADDAPLPRRPMVVERDGTRLIVRYLCEGDQCLLHLEERTTAVIRAALEPLGLTRRQIEVLHWVTLGKTNADVGAILGLSSRTVQKHLDHIFKKLGVETRVAAATLAMGWRSGV